MVNMETLQDVSKPVLKYDAAEEEEEDSINGWRRVANRGVQIHPLILTSAAQAQYSILPPTDLRDLADRLEVGVDEWIKSDAVLLGILLGPFEANWFKAKACLTMDNWPLMSIMARPPPHALGLKLMAAMVDMRARKWSAFARKTLPRVRTAVEHAAATSQFVFEAPGTTERLLASKDEDLSLSGAVGCQCVTSDMDFSLTGVNSEIGIGLLNNAFAEEFGVPFQPGTVFDINIYSVDWMHGHTEVKCELDVNVDHSTVVTFKPEYEQRALVIEPADVKERADILEVWSLVKIRRNTSSKQWDIYASTTLACIDQDKGAKNAMKKKLIDAEFEYWSCQVRLQTKLEVMDATFKLQEAQFGYNQCHSAFNEKYTHEARQMCASDMLYQETALQVRDLRIRLDILKETSTSSPQEVAKLAKQLAYKIAEGLTYANEAYGTEGALLHTVYGKQEAKRRLAQLQAEGRVNLTTVKFILTPEHYLQSLNENVGFALRSLQKFQAQPQYAVYLAGKSIERLCEAAASLFSYHIASTKLPGYATLKEIAVESVRAKHQEIGRDPKAVYRDFYFRDFDSLAHVQSLSLRLIYFGARASAMFHNGKQGMGS